MKNKSVQNAKAPTGIMPVNKICDARLAGGRLLITPPAGSLVNEEAGDAKPPNSTIRPLKELPELFKLIQCGTFIAPELKCDTSFDLFHCQLHLKVQLELKDSKGIPFIAQRTYNFAPSSRGRGAVIEDYQDWTGRKLTREQLWAFDPRKFAAGKPVVVELEVRRHRRSFDLWIKAFRPPRSGVTTTTIVTTTERKVG